MSREPFGPCQHRYQHSTTLQCRSSATCHTVHRKDLTQARMNRDLVDLEKINAKLMGCFSPDPSLRNIVNGVVAQEFVNVHEYEEVGRVIMDNMIGKPAFTF